MCVDNVLGDINFNGDISKWKVYNVTNVSCMFNSSKFNQDISKWDVSLVLKYILIRNYSIKYIFI
jgi:hypothetical protein